MRFLLPDAFIEFFSKHQFLEIEAFLSEKERKSLLLSLEESLSKRESKRQPSLPLSSWHLGKNLWKDDLKLKKMLFTSLKLGPILFPLFKKRPIRLAYTQIIFASPQGASNTPFLQQETITEISSMAPLLGGVLFNLSPKEEEETRSFLPHGIQLKSGSALFFSSSYPLPLPELFARPNARFLLIALAPQHVRYQLQSKDIHTHTLKKEGYAFGDLFTEEESPYLYC